MVYKHNQKVDSKIKLIKKYTKTKKPEIRVLDIPVATPKEISDYIYKYTKNGETSCSFIDTPPENLGGYLKKFV